jgi:FkbM family methyltransferase
VALEKYGEWAQSEIELMCALLGEGSTVVDVGAFIGTHALAFSRHVGSRGTVHAFELHPQCFELLQRNLAANAAANTRALNLGLAERECEETVALFREQGRKNHGVTSLIERRAAGIDDQVAVRVGTLDGQSLQACDLIKVDVEGAEAQVLRGAVETIRRFRPFVYAECNSLEHGWAVCPFMRDLGYRVFLHNALAFNPDNFRGCRENIFGGAREAALVLVPEEKLAALMAAYPGHAGLIPIATIDDLALGMLKKPQYKFEVLAKTGAAGVLGVNFFATEMEILAVQARIRSLQLELDRLRQEK